MFECRFLDGKLFRKLIDAIRDVAPEEGVNIDCDINGLRLQAMDSSHVSLVVLHLPSDGGAFAHYRCDAPISLGLKLESVQKICKVSGGNDTITLRADSPNADYMYFIFESINQSKIAQFRLQLLSIDQEHLAIPETEYGSIVKLPSSELNRVCREMKSLEGADTIRIIVSKSTVKFIVNSNIGNGLIEYKNTRPIINNSNNSDSEDSDNNDESTNDPQCSIRCSIESNQSFAMKYLQKFSTSYLSKYVELKQSPDIPLLVDYQLELEGQTVGTLKFFLAPKLESED